MGEFEDFQVLSRDDAPTWVLVDALTPVRQYAFVIKGCRQRGVGSEQEGVVQVEHWQFGLVKDTL
jgi:hypothetical protein